MTSTTAMTAMTATGEARASPPVRPSARLARPPLPGLAAFAALAGVIAACATAPPPRTVPASGEPPWRVPAAAYGTQRLYRAGYAGPEGEGGFRLTLRLAAPDRYQVQAVDPVGRALWSLDVDGRRGLWLDHRAQTACPFDGRLEVAGLPMASIPLSALPALLLERLPEEPADEPRWEGGRLSYRDSSGRGWTATVGEAGVESWAVADEEGPAAWWTRRESWSVLSDRRRQAQVRWREVLREELTGALAPLEAPPGYRRGTCTDGAGPALVEPAPDGSR